MPGLTAAPPPPLTHGAQITVDPATIYNQAAIMADGRLAMQTDWCGEDATAVNAMAEWVAGLMRAALASPIPVQVPGQALASLSAATGRVLALMDGGQVGPLLALPPGLGHQDVQVLHAVAAERAAPGSQSGIGGEPDADAPARDWHAWACRAVARSESAHREDDPLYRRHWLIAAAAALIAEIEALDRALEDAARVIAATPAEVR